MRRVRILLLAILCLLFAGSAFAQNVEFIGNYDTPGDAYDVFVDSIYAYVADGEFGIQIIDVSESINPVFAGTYDTPDEAIGVFIANELAYVADGYSGLQIININDPTSPSLEGSYVLNEPFMSCVGVIVSDGYAYTIWRQCPPRWFCSDRIIILDVNNPQNPTFVGIWDIPGLGDIYVDYDHI